MRQLALPLGLFMLVGLTGGWAQTATLPLNPGFEAGSVEKGPDSWNYSDYKTGGTPLYDRQAGRGKTAAVGIRVADDKQRGSWRQEFTSGEAEGVVVEGWYRTEGMTTASGATVRLTYLKPGKGWDMISDASLRLPVATEWTAFRQVFQLPAGTARYVAELFNFFVPGTVWWDDLKVRAASPEEVDQMFAQGLDAPRQEGQVEYAPLDGATVSVNPPAFIWLPVKGQTEYVVQYSRDPQFAAAATTTVKGLSLTVHTPTQTLPVGKWYWRYGVTVPSGRVVYSRSRGFTIPAEAITFPKPTVEEALAKIPTVRPRIYFTPETVAEIRADKDGRYKNVVRNIVNNAERRLGEALYPEPKWLPKDPQERSKAYLLSFQTMRPWTSAMETCALAYVCTGERKYADEARRRLLHFATWDVEGPTSVYHDDEAHMDIIMRGPRTYDWIYDTLSAEDRKICEDFLRRRLVQTNQMHRKMPFESRPYASHQGRMIGFMVEATLVFAHELPESREWLDYYLAQLWSTYPAWGSDDGGWHEGISYWTAYLSMMTQVVAELNRLGIPWKDKPFLQNTGYFGLYCAYPGRKHTAFGDGQEGSVGAGQGNLLYALSSIYDNPYFRWYAEKTGGGAGSGALGFTLLKPELKSKSPADLPQARSFPSVGWVAMHSEMASPADNVMMLFHSSPFGAVSHNHANQNAFVLEAFGEPLAISSGYYQRYGSPHHAQWTWQTKAHNSILVDNEGQVPRRPTSRGKIVAFENHDAFCYTTGDATEAYGGRLKKFLRHVLFVRPGYFVVYDELESVKPATYQWLLHAKSELQLDPDKLSVTSAQGDSRLRVQFLQPEKLQFSQHDKFDAAPDKAETPNQWHFQAATTNPAETMRFVTVLAPYKAGQESQLPAVKRLPAQGGVALAVGEDLIAWKDADSRAVQAGDLRSEAEVVCVRRGAGGQATMLFVRGQGAVSLRGAALRP